MNKYAFTLIEVIVSALILTLTVGGVLFIFTTEKGAVGHTGRRMQAMDFARQTLEQLKNKVGADTWDEAGQPLTVQDWTSYETLSGDFGTVFSGQRRYRVDPLTGVDSSTGYREVTVEVNWIEPEMSE